MPRKQTERDRQLAFAFTATAEQLEEAIAIFTAALRAKKGKAGPAPKIRTTAQPKRSGLPAAGSADQAEGANG